MTNALMIQTRKEVRALLPWTIGVAVTCAALGVMAPQNGILPTLRQNPGGLFILVYALGVLSLAALSMGQELTHGTLPALLVQPLDRRRVLGLKLMVLAIPLIGLGVLGDAVFPEGYLPDARRILIWGPVAAGFGLVPLLTVLTRRPMGGVVFSITIPGLFLLVGTRIYPLQDPALTFAWYGTLAACAVGLGALFVLFRRLEVAGDGREMTAGPAPRAAETAQLPGAEYAPTVRRSWIWLLVKKELRVQQMTFAVSGLYVMAALAVMVMSYQNPKYVGPSFGAISLIHAYFLPLMAGALASAEERSIGTLAGQILMPRHMRLQWAIKAGVTVGVALVLTIGIPALLTGALHKPVDSRFSVEPLGLATLCVTAMYISSLSSNSLWALLGSLPVLGAALLIGGTARTYLWRLVFTWFPYRQSAEWEFVNRAFAAKEPWVRSWIRARVAAAQEAEFSVAVIENSLVVGFLLLVLYFAARNHRTIDRNARTVSIQLAVLALFAAVAATGAFVLSRTIRLWG